MRPILTYDLFKTITIKIEDLWIENQLYKTKLKALGVSPQSLKEELLSEQKNPETRKRANQQFDAVWKQLDKAADWFVKQDLGKEPPPSDEHN
jgi:hypothetical protein